MNVNGAAVVLVHATLDKAQLFAPGNERNDAVVFRL
jgi:hypothetical protein